ncbi:hypothetical protein U9M48_037173, partial [Paspalum notatum var. saurae]
MQGEALRGHNESSSSLNKGTYLELLDWYKGKVEVVKEAFDKGHKNCKMVSHHTEGPYKSMCRGVMAMIMDEIHGRKFSVLINESQDVSIKEQIAMILSHKLSISMLRGQGYDGASNMRGEFNGVQKLIRDENPYVFYVHCFAHQLQLVVVTVSTSTLSIADFFNYSTLWVHLVKRKALLAKHHDTLLEKVENGEILTGRGLNQESSLARPRDTRWGSHLKTVLRILVMWETIIDVLEIVKKDSIKPTSNGGAFGLIGKMESFDFVFTMHLMIELLNMTDICHDMRDNGWEPLFKRVKTFCEKNEIEVPDMDKEVNARGTSARRRQK